MIPHSKRVLAEEKNIAGIDLLLNDKPQEAWHLFMQATELDPTYADAHYGWGLAESHVKNDEAAIKRFQDAITLSGGRHQLAHEALAAILAQQGCEGAARYHQNEAETRV